MHALEKGCVRIKNGTVKNKVPFPFYILEICV